MPIELHTWAMAWVIAGQLATGMGVEYRVGPYRLHLKHIPVNVVHRFPERSTLSVQSPGIAAWLGQTPMGPGRYLQIAYREHHLRVHQNGPMHWVQWSSPWPVLKQITYASHGGWAARLEAGDWRIRLSPEGQSELALQRNQLRSLLSLQGERWQSRLNLKHFYAVAGGRGKWDYSRMGMARNGHYLEIYETHSTQGLDLQLTGKLKISGYELFGLFRQGLGPQSWMGRLAIPLGRHWQGTVHYSSSPWLQQASLSYRSPKGAFATARMYRNGIAVQMGSPTWSVSFQGQTVALRVHHCFDFPTKRPMERREEILPREPQLRIQTTGLLQHPVLRCLVVDAGGQEHVVHILSEEWQWKTHLPPGQYTWKTPELPPGYSLTFETPTFTLKPGEICSIRVQIDAIQRKITWIGRVDP